MNLSSSNPRSEDLVQNNGFTRLEGDADQCLVPTYLEEVEFGTPVNHGTSELNTMFIDEELREDDNTQKHSGQDMFGKEPAPETTEHTPPKRGWMQKARAYVLPLAVALGTAVSTSSCDNDDPKPKPPTQVEPPKAPEKPVGKYEIFTFESPRLGTVEYYRDDHGTVLPTHVKLDKFAENPEFRANILEIINTQMVYAMELNGGEFDSIEEFIELAKKYSGNIRPIRRSILEPYNLQNVGGYGGITKYPRIDDIFNLEINLMDELLERNSELSALEKMFITKDYEDEKGKKMYSSKGKAEVRINFVVTEIKKDGSFNDVFFFRIIFNPNETVVITGLNESEKIADTIDITDPVH